MVMDIIYDGDNGDSNDVDNDSDDDENRDYGVGDYFDDDYYY